MAIELAVGPSTRAPGLYMKVNLLAGVSSPGTALQRAIVMAPRSSAGTLVQDSEIRLIASAEDAKTAFGPKTPGYLFALRFFRHHPSGVLYGIAPTASAGNAASGTITFGSTPTSARTVRIHGAGKIVDVPWAPNETADALKTRAMAYVNARPDFPATATSGGTGIVTLTFPIAGPWGNDVLISVELLDGAGGTAEASDTTLTGGTTEPDFSTALSAISNTKFDYIAPLLSNADAQGSGATTNVARVRTHINTFNTGLDARLQQAVVASTGTLSAAKTGAIARNEPTIEMPFCMAGQGLPAELAGAELGSRMAAVELNPAKNRIGTVLDDYVGAADLTTDKPTASEIEDALANGLTIISYNGQGQAVVVRPITSHSQDANGNPDDRCFDLSGVDGMYAIANDLETFLPQAFYQVNVSRDLTADDEALPEGVVEERDIKAELITRLRYWAGRGVARRDKLQEAIDQGTLIVRVNPSDESQVDIVVPAAIYRPLAKLGVVVNKVA